MSDFSETGSLIAARSTRVSRWPELLLIVTAAVLHLVAILNAPPLQSANDRSRWCTVRSLIEDGSYRIDRVRQQPGWDTIDLIRRDGHFYSTKPPLMSTWVAGVTAAVMQVTGWTFPQNLASINTATLILVNGLPFVLGLIALAWWLRCQYSARETVLLTLTVAAFGTLLSPFLTSINNHTPAALGVLVALLCWWPPACCAHRWVTLRFAVWGFAASWAACHDLPAAAFTLAMLLLAGRESLKRTLLVFVPAAAVPAAAFLVCNVIAMEGLVPAYSGYGGETYRFLHNGVPSYWLQPQGVDRALETPLVYFLNCTIGHHGWFLLTPVWLLVLLPLLKAVRPATARERWLIGLTAGLSVIVLGFYLMRTSNYNYGGVSCGLRWAIFLTPLWLLSLSVAIDRLPRTVWVTVATCLTLSASIYSAWEPMSRAWQQPWAFHLANRWGWTPANDPPTPFPQPRYSWFADVPHASPSATSDDSTGSLSDGVWVEFAGESAFGHRETLRLTFAGVEQVRNRECVVVEIARTTPLGDSETRTLKIDRAAWRSGHPPARCLVWTDPAVTPAQQQADFALFRGLPLLKSFNPGFERYLFLPLRTDAFACQRTAAQVDHAADAESPRRRFRCDAWLSPEIPFGTARVEWTVTDPESGETLQREVWTVVDCSPRPAAETPVTLEMFTAGKPIVPQLERLRDAR